MVSTSRLPASPNDRLQPMKPESSLVTYSGSSSDRRKIAIVLGMHRSGTSVLSHVMHLLGCDMADERDTASPKNPYGFWERPDLVAIHDEILAVIGRSVGSAEHILPFPTGWWRRKDIQTLKRQLTDAVDAHVRSSSDLWGFKDPRTSRMLPLWREITRALDLEPIYVHAIRSPLSAARSMSLKNPKARPLSVAQSELMWLAYNYDIVRHAPNEAMLCVDYDEWFIDPEAVARKIQLHFELPNIYDDAEFSEMLQQVISEDFRHHKPETERSKSPSIATLFYKTLHSSLNGENTKGLEAQLPAVELFLKSLGPIVEQLQRIPELEKANEDLHSDLSELVKRRQQVVELKIERDKLQAKTEEIAALRSQIEAFEFLKSDIEKARDLAIEKASKLEADINSVAAQAASHAAELADSQSAVAALREEIKTLKVDRDNAASRADSNATELLRKQSDVLELKAKIKALEIERDRAAALVGSQAKKIDEGYLAVAELKTTIKDIEASLEKAETIATARCAEVERAMSEREAAERVCKDATAATAELEAQSLNLKQLIAERDELNEDLRSRLSETQMSLRLSDERLAAATAINQDRLQTEADLRDAIDRLERQTQMIAAEAEHDRHRMLKLKERLARSSIAEQTSGVSVVGGHMAYGQSRHDVMRINDFMAEHEVGDVIGSASLDGNVIAGWAVLKAHPDRPLVIEAWIGDDIIASALTSTLHPDPSYFRPLGSFEIPVTTPSRELGAQTVTLKVAGTSVVLGSPIEIRAWDVAREVKTCRETESFTTQEYRTWLEAHHRLDADHLAAVHAAYVKGSGSWPLVSVILIDADRGDEATRRSIASMIDQVYDRWELIISDEGTSSQPADNRVVFKDADLADVVRSLESQFVCFLSAGDVLSPDALVVLVTAAKRSDADLTYSDEDRFDPDNRRREAPWLKSAWSFDLFLIQNFAQQLGLVRVERLAPYVAGLANSADVYAALLRMTFSEPALSAQHVPAILYHRDRNAPCLAERLDSVRTIVFEDHDLKPETMPEGRIIGIQWPLPDPLPRVSLIVPTRDRLDLLEPCISGILNRTDYPDIEVLIVDNESAEPETIEYLNKIVSDDRVKVINWPGPFNYSEINNFAADRATGDIIGLVNNDILVIEPDWLSRMVRQAVRVDVGSVGARLLYADGTLQHAGITMGIGTASHRYKGKPADHDGHAGVLQTAHDVTAVTAACLVLRKSVWRQVGGLADDFPVAYNDVDFCLKVRQAGYRVVYEPRAMLFHLESQSRGLDQDEGRKARLHADRDRLNAKWTDQTVVDPFYSPNLAINSTDAKLGAPPRIDRIWLCGPSAEFADMYPRFPRSVALKDSTA